MKLLLKATCLVAVLALHASAQDAYINGHQWYGHEVDSCYIDFDRIRDQGDRRGTFEYAKRHLRTLTRFEHGQPVFVVREREVPPDDVVLVLVRRVGESQTYWTDPAALSTRDPLASQKAAAAAALEAADKERARKAHEQFLLEQQMRERALAALKTAQPPRRPIATRRYWQVAEERFRGKLINANQTHVKIRRSDDGKTIVVDRRHLSETSDSYVDSMLQDLESYREYQELIAVAS